MATIWCSHSTRQVDRFLCPPPCGAIHVRCAGCGAAVGGCPFESDGLHERLVATLGAHLPRAEEWQVRDLAEIVERGGHASRVLPLSEALAQVGLGGGRQGCLTDHSAGCAAPRRSSLGIDPSDTP